MNWQEMLKLEPRLDEVDRYLKTMTDKRDGWADNPWPLYDESKKILSRHVGLMATGPKELQTPDAWDCGLRHITDRLGI
jgi:hypothetical protein